ncbi:MAG: hypothetical protein HRO68_06735 [Nitrosopumilus sp.]|nr:hypothetical protein [Nitrosopumilus sp.]
MSLINARTRLSITVIVIVAIIAIGVIIYLSGSGTGSISSPIIGTSSSVTSSSVTSSSGTQTAPIRSPYFETLQPPSGPTPHTWTLVGEMLPLA